MDGRPTKTMIRVIFQVVFASDLSDGFDLSHFRMISQTGNDGDRKLRI